jgi:hypothetical protein
MHLSYKNVHSMVEGGMIMHLLITSCVVVRMQVLASASIPGVWTTLECMHKARACVPNAEVCPQTLKHVRRCWSVCTHALEFGVHSVVYTKCC